MTGPRQDRETGFTLLELLVAVAVLGFLTLLTVQGVRFGMIAWASTDERALDAASMRAVEGVMRRAIGGAYPAFAYSDRSDRRIAFAGDQEMLAVVAPLPESVAAGVLARQRFFVADDGSGRALFGDWQLDLPASADDASIGGTTIKLVPHIRSVRFAYFGPPSSGQAPQWLDHWADQPALPLLVRIRIEQDVGHRTAWPDLVIQTRITANTACLHDAAAIDCQRIR